MKRREFISTGAVAAAGVSSLLTSCNSNSPKTTAASTTTNDITDFELNEENIISLQEKMAAGKLSAGRITNLYLHRIETVDKDGPRLNSVIEINPDAISI